MVKKNIYEIYEDGVMLARGGVYDIARPFKLKANKISTYALDGRLVKGKYIIKKVGEVERTYVKRAPSIQTREEVIDYFIRHLNDYGNVAARLHEDPSIYLSELNDMGYKCVVTRYRELDKDDLLTTTNKRTIEYEYVLTRV